jgi:long-subunit fatty acid transport protein
LPFDRNGGWLVKQLSRSRWTQCLLAIAVIAAAAPAALAVTDEEIFRDFRFNLSNPGARSLGLGGAFIAVADDATAALANPAGLMLLEKPEFFTEIRDRVADDSSLEQSLSPFESVSSETFPNAVFSPSFVSYVYPSERWAAGVSRVELNKADNNTSSLFLIDFDADPNTPPGAITADGSIRTDLSVWNITGAVRIIDTLSFGASVAVGLLDIESSVINTLIDTDPNSATPFVPQTLYETEIDDNDTDVSFTAGLHWRPLSQLSFGAVYRGGFEFTVMEDLFNDGFFGFGYSTFIGAPLDTTFNTPDSYGAGVAWQPMPALTLSADWVHIEYEDLLDGFQSALNILTFTDDRNQFTIEDADEIHVGGEYVFTAGSVPVAVRLGGYTDHNSRIFADFEDPDFTSFGDNDTFPERDTEEHVTVGAGVVVQGKFQIDAAADFSDIVNEYVLSTIFRF